MAFADFTHRVQVQVDNKAIWDYCNSTFGVGHWGKMFPPHGETATYCFEYENDALMFLLRWPDA